MNHLFRKPEVKRTPRKPRVVPGQCLSLSQSIQRLNAGNSFGVTQFPTEYDGESDDMEPVDIDQSDPLISKLHATVAMKEIHTSYQKMLEKKDNHPEPGTE